MAFNIQIKLFVTTYRENINNVSENTLQVWYTLKEQSDQGRQFYKRLKPIFFAKKWAFVHPAKLSSGLLSSGILSSGLLS